MSKFNLRSEGMTIAKKNETQVKGRGKKLLG